MSFRRLVVSSILSMSIILMIIPGCQSQKSPSSSSTISSSTQRTGNLRIVTSFYPIYLSVINITKDIDDVEVVNLTTSQSGCLHDYQLKPQDVKTLEQCDVFVINGLDMENFINDVIKQQPDLNIINASKNIEPIIDQNGLKNPHVWVSITSAMTQVRNIADALANIDQKNAINYKKNASLYLAELNKLRTKATTELSALKKRDIVTFHEAFPYFAKEFNLNILSVIEREPGSTPTPKELEATIKIVKDSNTKAIFAEPQYNSKAAQTIADATNAKVYILDPIVTGESSAKSINNYIITMQKNIETLKEALG